MDRTATSSSWASGACARRRRPGWTTIPAIVRDTADEDMLRDALLENLHRSQLNPLEEAAAYQQLLDDFGCTHEELADRIGRSRPQISNTLRLLRLSPAVQRRVAAGVLSAGHARALVSVSSPEIQDRLAQRVVAEGLSVRALEEIVTVSPETERRSARRPGGRTARAEAHRPGSPVVGPIRYPRPGRPRSIQGQDHRRVRDHRGPGADRGSDGSAPSRPPGAVTD